MSPRVEMPFETAGGMFSTQFGGYSQALHYNEIGICETALKKSDLAIYRKVLVKAEKWRSGKFATLFVQVPFVLVPLKEHKLPPEFKGGHAVLPLPDDTILSYASHIYKLRYGDWLTLNPNLNLLQMVPDENLVNAIQRARQRYDPAYR